MFDLTGKTALVTGASGGIGGAIAEALHAQGAIVALSGTRRQPLDDLAAKLGERVHVIPANLSSAEEVEKLAKDAEAALGSLDILVNNAGLTKDGLVMRMKDEDWEHGDRRQSDRRFPPLPRLRARHDEAPLRPHHQHHLGGRRDRQSRPGQLLRLEGRPDRHEQIPGPGSRFARHHGQLHRPGIHHFGDDRCAE